MQFDPLRYSWNRLLFVHPFELPKPLFADMTLPKRNRRNIYISGDRHHRGGVADAASVRAASDRDPP